MKKIPLILVLTLFSVMSYSQSQRILYEYTFKLDSTDRGNAEKEMMVLDIGKDGSHFYSYQKFVYDSLVAAELKKSAATMSTHIDLSKMRNTSKIGSRVTKKYPGFETILHTSVGGEPFTIAEQRKMQWNILPETKNIGGFKAQKATTEFGGRKWTGWFTDEIQIQDGPYKFSSLPGLILEVGDEKGDHVFRFAGSSKRSTAAASENEDQEKGIPITEEKFRQLWNEYLRDPAKKLRQMFSGSDAVLLSVTDASGKQLSQAEIIRGREQMLREKLKKTNNFLELTLYR
ncbi:GLPGLI family protein [Chryseobacterium sp.]|uniref:GLPGLI family protein n=1 Tax=Chryseobacterium sp. TaxID=1871047 RepID=UPI0011C9BB81|nr:GLPGLI family protein [Chryseobacterium sp.]TXF75805.1 GLPGLI family protein [Chryseobacterium sp.]